MRDGRFLRGGAGEDDVDEDDAAVAKDLADQTCEHEGRSSIADDEDSEEAMARME